MSIGRVGVYLCSRILSDEFIRNFLIKVHVVREIAFKSSQYLIVRHCRYGPILHRF